MLSGVCVSRYRLERLIGVGGMAEIYRARVVGMEGFEWICVVKRILPELARNETFVSLFLDEARITVKLRHPNIVQVFDLGRKGAELYMVMEFVDGLNLSTIVQLCRGHSIELHETIALHVVAGVLKALDYAHHATTLEGEPLQVVHRDVSLSNVLVGRDGGVKLSDFGIATAATARTELRRGTFVGKHRYMPPEVARGGVYSAAGDLFAVGAVLFELLAGERLLPGATFDDNVAYLADEYDANARVESARERLGGLAPVVARAIAADPAARYTTADQFLEDLTCYRFDRGLRTSRSKLAKFLDQLTELAEQEASEISSDSLGEISFSCGDREVTGLEDLDRAYARTRDRAMDSSVSVSRSGPEDITEILEGDETLSMEATAPQAPDSVDHEFCLSDERYDFDHQEVDHDAVATPGPEGVSLDEELDLHSSISEEFGGISIESGLTSGGKRRHQIVLFQRGEVLGPLTPAELEATLTGDDLDPSGLLSFDDEIWNPVVDYAPEDRRPQGLLRHHFNVLQLGPTLLNVSSTLVRHRITLWSGSQAAQLVVGGGRLWYTALAGIASPLRQILLEEEGIPSDAIPPLPENAPLFERQMLDLLVERGALPPARIEGLSQLVMRRTLALAFQWPYGGEFIMDDWCAPGTIETWERPLDLLPTIALVARTCPHDGIVAQLLRERKIDHVQTRGDALARLPQLPLTPQEAALLRRIGPRRPLAEVLYLDGEQHQEHLGHIVYLLIQLGLVTVSKGSRKNN